MNVMLEFSPLYGGNNNEERETPTIHTKPKDNPEPKKKKTKADLEKEFNTLGRDPKVEWSKELEHRRRMEFGNNAYDLEFTDLQTDRGFLYDSETAQQIYNQRKLAGEITDDMEENDTLIE